MEVHGGFNGLAELLIFRVLHYMLGEEPHKIEVTRDLRAFHYPKSNLVLAAGYPLQVGLRRKWLDIIVYKPKEGKPKEIEELLSVVEVKFTLKEESESWRTSSEDSKKSGITIGACMQC